MKVVDALYRVLLLGFSASLRRRWGNDMAQLVRDQMDDARTRGESRSKILWLALWDVLANGLGERLSRARRWLIGSRESELARPSKGDPARTRSDWWTVFGQDVWFALRQFRRRPAFALATVVVLGLGIAASTAVFSVVDGVLLKALPLPHADRLVRVLSDVPNSGIGAAPLPDFEDWRREGGPFEAMGAFFRTVHSFTRDELPERIIVGSTVGDFFGAAGLEATIGRTYGAIDGVDRGAAYEPVILLTHDFWRRSFGADPSAVGRTVELDGQQVLVLGVLPAEEKFLRFGRSIDAWAPMGEPLFWMGRGTGFLTVLGRLQPDLTPETAVEPLEALANGLIETGNTENGIAMVALRDALIGNARTLLWALQGAALLLMLVVAANAANLLLARSLDRSGEFAVRTALGAGRSRIARQVLVETTLLGLLSGVAGLGLALLGRDMVLSTVPNLTVLAGPARVSWGVLVYTFGTALGVGILAGLWPAIRATSRSWSAMQEAGRSVSRAQGGRRVMVAVEVGLALMLLVSAGLMVRTTSSLLGEELGFEPDNVLTARITLPEARYPEWPQRHRFFNDLMERVGALPGVEAVALTSALPLSSAGDGGTFRIEGRVWPDGEGPTITKKSASAGYFAAMEIALVAGREFTSQDRADSPLVTVVSESMARRFFPDESPLGKKIWIGWWDDEFMEIVGVVADVKQSGRDQGAEIAAYRPQTQIGALDATIVIRTSGDPYGLTLPVHAAVLKMDAGQPIYGVTTMDEVVSGSLARQTALTSLLLGLSLAAMGISCLGICAVTAQAVRARSEEIGIRMALGATGRDVLRSVMLTEGRVIALGMVLGLAGAAATTSALETLLFGVTRLDLPTLIASVATLGGLALLAALGPALRAARIDPAGSLGR